jgi:hypothetical protein
MYPRPSQLPSPKVLFQSILHHFLRFGPKFFISFDISKLEQISPNFSFYQPQSCFLCFVVLRVSTRILNYLLHFILVDLIHTCFKQTDIGGI